MQGNDVLAITDDGDEETKESVEWVPNRMDFPLTTKEIEQAATAVHRLSDAAIITLRQKRRSANIDNQKDSTREEEKEWYSQVYRLRLAAERFVKQVLEEHGIAKRRLTRTERKRRAREALSFVSGIEADRQQTAKRRKAASNAILISLTSPTSSTSSTSSTSPSHTSTVSSPIEIDDKDDSCKQQTAKISSPISTASSSSSSSSATNVENEKEEKSNVKFTKWEASGPNVTVEDEDGEERDEQKEMYVKGKCYVCRIAYKESERHDFYPRMCQTCGKLNYSKREQLCNLHGKYALVTGGRVNIGYEIVLRLLRSGCYVIVTTRFPNDALLRYATEKDFETFRSRLEFVGIDLRFPDDIKAVCEKLKKRLPQLDILINNAAQTIRRPAKYYQHLLQNELKPPQLLLPNLVTNTAPKLITGDDPIDEKVDTKALLLVKDSTELIKLPKMGELGRAAQQTQLVISPEDQPGYYPDHMFPEGQRDQHLQQLDLRPRNSWIMRPEEITPIELLETQVVNAVAPFLLFTNLLPLLKLAANAKKDGYAFVINVTAEEGTFNRHHKDSTHVHTNMAKAGMNQITRSCAERYAKHDRILMNSVDTGWVDDMTPVAMPNRRRFEPPLAAPDGAARVLDPIFIYFNQGIAHYGVRFKDYNPAPW